MFRLITVLMVFIFLAALTCKKKPEMNVFEANDNRLNWHGRTFEDKAGKKYLISSASCLRFRFLGDECRIRLQNGSPPGEYNYISFVVDGVHHQKIAVKSSQPFDLAIPNLKKGLEFHDVELYKETESSSGQIIISSIEAHNLGDYPQAKRKKIEFIGNSITAGMDSDPSLVPCSEGKPYDQHNAYEAYGPRVSRTLNMDFMIMAVSGIGVYRNWSTDFPVMADIYDHTFMTGDPNDPKWKFEVFTPDIVCINLGTNDFSDGDGITERLPFDSSRFINRYVELISKIHAHYPDAKCILLQHPMSGEHNMEMFHACLQSVKHAAEESLVNIKPIEIFSFSPFIPGGCGGHPGLKDHERMAEELAAFIRDNIDR
jgi:hypothetical protein